MYVLKYKEINMYHNDIPSTKEIAFSEALTIFHSQEQKE